MEVGADEAVAVAVDATLAVGVTVAVELFAAVADAVGTGLGPGQPSSCVKTLLMTNISSSTVISPSPLRSPAVQPLGMAAQPFATPSQEMRMTTSLVMSLAVTLPFPVQSPMQAARSGRGRSVRVDTTKTPISFDRSEVIVETRQGFIAARPPSTWPLRPSRRWYRRRSRRCNGRPKPTVDSLPGRRRS